MQFIQFYDSPLGEILLVADDTGLKGVWFTGQKYYALNIDGECEERESPILRMTKEWLNVYFSGRIPDFTLPLHFLGTEFQNTVWEMLCTIPYGKTETYSALAQSIAKKKGLPHMSAQAVGGAVAHNPISILVPCHRVVGKDGNLTGYSGGLEKKIFLLKKEGAWKDIFFLPKHDK